MASVYVALDARLDRQVALKIMRPGLARDAVFVERFRSEARASAKLSHPNVVAVFDQGEDDGEVFLAMELVEGKTLRDVIHEEAPLTPREAFAILEPILEALRAAHDAGLIHRDVKPENVIIRRDGEVKVADFGLARAITNQATTSQTGVLLGTVSYLSPEQVERGATTPRSDLYAAGLLLFEMLTGHKAVTGETPIQIAYKHVHGSIPAPSSIVEGLAPALDDLVARATATEPDARYQSAAEFLHGMRTVRNRLGHAALDARGDAPASPQRPPATGSPTTRTSVDDHTVAEPRAPRPRPRHEEQHGPDGRHGPDVPADSRGATAPTTGTRATTVAASATGAPARSPRERTAEEPVVSPTTAIPIGQSDPRRRRYWPVWLLLAIVVLGGGTIGWWFTSGPGSTTLVPTVANTSLTDAEATLSRAGLTSATSEAFSETVPRGDVISGDPDAGAQVAKRSTVNLLVSKGPERYTVPNLVGAPVASLADELSPLTLKVGAQTEAWSETVEQGLVIKQEPTQGEPVKRNTPIDVVVSKGREPMPVPAVTGEPVDAATAKITDANLTVKRLPDANSDTVPSGRVISQQPADGALFRGDEVAITVSKGPIMVMVPRVLGKQVADAEKTLKALGFAVTIRRPLGTFFELVRDQSVAPETQAPKGTTIILTVV